MLAMSSPIYGLWETNYKGLKILKNKAPLDIYELSLYLNKAIEKRAREVSKIKFKILDKKTGEKSKSAEAEKWLDLLRKPNNVFAGTEFWRLYQIYRDLCGEAFIKLDFKGEAFEDKKNILEMHLLIPDAVKIIRSKDDASVKEYKYGSGLTTLTYQPQEVIRNYSPDPKNQIMPVGLIKAGVGILETEIQLRDYQNKVLSNGGRIEGVFKFKTKAGLTKKQLQELKDGYESQYAGSERAGKPLFLGGDADYQRVALNPQELAYLESMKATLDDICILTEVPKAILSNLTDVKFTNAEESEKIFLAHTIKPLLDDLVNNLNDFLLPDNLVLSYEEIVAEDENEKRENLKLADSISAITTNEKREQLGLEPIKGGDEVLIPMNKVPLYTEGEITGTKKKEFNHPLSNEKNRRIYHKQVIKRMDNNEKKMRLELKRYFKGQEKRIIDNLDEIKSFKKKGFESEIFNLANEVDVSISAFSPLLEKFYKEEGIETVNRVGYKYDFVVDGDAESWINERTSLFSQEINNTTYKKLARDIAESMDNEETRQELIERIKKEYVGINKSRVPMIARTEVHSVTSYANFKGYKQAGIPIKIWVAVMDSQTRPSHQMLDGEEKPIDIPFSNGLMMPGDPSGASDEIVGCRCVI